MFFGKNSGNYKRYESLKENDFSVNKKYWNKYKGISKELANEIPEDKLYEIVENYVSWITGNSLDEEMHLKLQQLPEILRKGQSHEFYKMNIEDENLLKERNANMKRLYEIFDVEPVPEKEMITENSLIKVKSTEWRKQYSELWDLLVPGAGRAEFVQGEAIRLVGKLSYEVIDMGCCNWDDDFKKLPEAYLLLISYGEKLDDKEYENVKSIMNDIKKLDDDDFNYIAEITVKWILKNPVPVKLSNFKNEKFIGLEYLR